MQRESESEENVSWNEIREVLDTEMSTVEDIRADLARNDKGDTCQTINNCMLVFQRDPLLKGAIRKMSCPERLILLVISDGSAHLPV